MYDELSSDELRFVDELVDNIFEGIDVDALPELDEIIIISSN